MFCLGNICRSPLAKGILENKILSSTYVDSAGTEAYHVGNPPDSRSIKFGKKMGLISVNTELENSSKKILKILAIFL